MRPADAETSATFRAGRPRAAFMTGAGSAKVDRQAWHSMMPNCGPRHPSYAAVAHARPRLATSEGDSMPASRRILAPLVAATALALGLAPPVFAGKTLDAVKARGEVS